MDKSYEQLKQDYVAKMNEMEVITENFTMIYQLLKKNKDAIISAKLRKDFDVLINSRVILMNQLVKIKRQLNKFDRHG